jgi:hypothetical protein
MALLLSACALAVAADEIEDPWDRFEPPPDEQFDWIQLTSGEWLKGDFKVMYELNLEFDSDELNLQDFDFEDVKRLRTRDPQTIFIEGKGGARDTSVVRGVLEIRDNDVILRNEDRELLIPRERVISIADGMTRERDHWSGMISIGVNARGGNTETTDTTVMANFKRRSAISRLSIDYLANYSQSREGRTADNQRLNANYDWFLAARFYWQVLAGEYYRDPFSNIDGQYSLSTGVGYDLIRTKKTEWGIGTGVGYQEQLFVSVEADQDDSSASPFFTAGTNFEREMSKRVDFLFDYSMRWLNEQNGQYTHHALTTLSIDLVKDFDLDLTLVWDRVEKPQADEEGQLPEQDDYQLIVSLAYDF